MSKTFTCAHEMARFALEVFIAEGFCVSDVSPDHSGAKIQFSTNRYGQKSAYMSVEGREVRISDHSTGTPIGYQMTTSWGEEDIRRFIDAIRAAAAKRAAEEAAAAEWNAKIEAILIERGQADRTGEARKRARKAAIRTLRGV